MSQTAVSPHYVRGMEYLVEVVQQLSLSKNREEIVSLIRHAAREITGADGASFILRDGDLCFYLDEEAIAPLWKGRRFPMHSCVSGWAMLNKASAVIEDIYQDARVPVEAYRPTFVKSMAMVPIRKDAPVGAIGNYWAKKHKPSGEELKLLEALANATAIALENVRLFADLKRTNTVLESSLQARDEFLTVASHELKTPLTALLLELQIARRGIDPDANRVPSAEKIATTFETTIRQGRTLADLIEKLLDLSRFGAGQPELQYASVNLRKLVESCLLRAQPQLSAAGVKTELDLDPTVEAECDGGRIEQILMSLISNVVKYAPGQPMKISLRAPDHGVITLKIQDFGPGIPASLHEKIFERFERGRTSENVSGLGLGLFISRRLVEAHGGRIHVESEIGKGATFFVELPCLKRS